MLLYNNILKSFPSRSFPWQSPSLSNASLVKSSCMNFLTFGTCWWTCQFQETRGGPVSVLCLCISHHLLPLEIFQVYKWLEIETCYSKDCFWWTEFPNLLHQFWNKLICGFISSSTNSLPWLRRLSFLVFSNYFSLQYKFEPSN